MPAPERDAGIGVEIKAGSPPQAGYDGSPPAAWCD